MRIRQYTFAEGSPGASWFGNAMVDVAQFPTWTLLDWAASIHALYPGFKALYYRNMANFSMNTVWGSAKWEPENCALLQSFCLKDGNGNYVHDASDTTWFYLDFGLPAYQTWLANYVADKVRTYGYDAVYLDNGFGARFWEIDYGMNTTPINPRYGTATWPDVDVQSYLISMYKAIKNVLPAGKLLLANGCYHGERWFDAKAGMQNILSNSPLDGIMSEGCFGSNFDASGNNIWEPETDHLATPAVAAWKDSVDFIADYQALYPNKIHVPVCYCSVAGKTTLPTGVNIVQKARFGFASTLLGMQHDTYLLCVTEQANLEQLYNLLYHLDMGNPLGPYSIVSGTHVYMRHFQNGIAVVNPSATPYTINVGGTYTDLDGVKASTFTIPAHTGNVLMGTITGINFTFPAGYIAGTPVNLNLKVA